MGYHTFDQCGARVVLQNNLQDYMYNNRECFLGFTGEIVISEGVTHIPSLLFCQSSPTSLTIPSTIESVGDWAFDYCAAQTVYINCNIPSFVGGWVSDDDSDYTNGDWFAENYFERVIIGDNVTSIGNYGLVHSNHITELVIGNSVETIGDYAFSSCFNLEDLKIGSSVESIGNYAFSSAFAGSSSTPVITISATVAPTITSNTFNGIKSNGTLAYPSGSNYSSWLSNSYSYLGYYGWVPNGYVRVQSISLNNDTLDLPVGYTGNLSATILPNNANNKSLSWTSSNTSVATVSNGVVTARAKGQATITATAVDNGMTSQCVVTVTDYVDLGLSVKWGTHNIGATSPEGFGNPYAWGEITTKNSFSWANYKWCNGTYTSLTKYNDDYQYGYVDMKYTLDSSDDVATVTLGSGYKIPSSQQWQELINNSTWTETTRNGVAGFLVTSTVSGYTDKYIFLPLAGLQHDINDPSQVYGSSTMARNALAIHLFFMGNPGSYTISLGNYAKCQGDRIRPVYESN